MYGILYSMILYIIKFKWGKLLLLEKLLRKRAEFGSIRKKPGCVHPLKLCCLQKSAVNTWLSLLAPFSLCCLWAAWLWGLLLVPGVTAMVGAVTPVAALGRGARQDRAGNTTASSKRQNQPHQGCAGRQICSSSRAAKEWKAQPALVAR